MSVFKIKCKELCQWIWDYPNKEKSKIEVIVDLIDNKYDYNSSQLSELREYLNIKFVRCYEKYWKDSHRMRERFEKNYESFMNEKFIYEFKKVSIGKAKSSLLEDSTDNISRLGRGRPRTSDKNCCERTQRRRVKEVLDNYDETIILKAASSIEKQVADKVQDDEVHNDNLNEVNKTLAMYMDTALTKAKYETLRIHFAYLSGNKQLPNYKEITKAKKACYPQNINVNDHGAEIQLQSLLDHTAERLLSLMSSEQIEYLNSRDVVLHGKWGFDGASGQQQFKQKWTNDENTLLKSDASVMMVSYVPLAMSSFDEEVIWKNNRPSSVRLCRPIKFQFVKETREKIDEMYTFYSEEIIRLQPTSVTVNKEVFTVSHKLYCTMIDGKVCNVLTGQSSSASCNVCKASPNQMNDLEGLRKLTVHDEYNQFGLSSLHCRIRFMECLLHISYNLDFKQSTATKDNKELKKSRKTKIQDSLRSRLSILVDVVKQGHGSTNDGNTARRFFENPEVVAEVTGINIELIQRFANILQVLTCGSEIDSDKFESYALDTAKLYVRLYPWYKMPPSVHKVLIHGASIIRTFGLPIGWLSEEAQEANNKVFKRGREHFSRLFSRSICNEDVMHYMLISSDPVISGLRVEKKKKNKDLSDGAKRLIKVYDDEILISEDEKEEEEEEEERMDVEEESF